MFVLTLVGFGGMQFVIDHFAGEFTAAQSEIYRLTIFDWQNFTTEVQQKYINNCNFYFNMTTYLYFALYIFLWLTIIFVTWFFKYTVRTKYFSEHVYHDKLTNQYIIWLSLSLFVKMFLGTKIFSFDSSTLAIQPLSELLMITLFSIFKRDEDCFDCFRKCDYIENYSIFQIKQNRYFSRTDTNSSISGGQHSFVEQNNNLQQQLLNQLAQYKDNQSNPGSFIKNGIGLEKSKKSDRRSGSSYSINSNQN